MSLYLFIVSMFTCYQIVFTNIHTYYCTYTFEVDKKQGTYLGNTFDMQFENYIPACL